MHYKVSGLARLLGTACLVATTDSSVLAAETPAPASASAPESATQTSSKPPETRSPWLFLPTFSSNPKLGNAVGAMGAYVTKFDPKSQVSIFGLSAQYTDTDSATAAAIARASFGADHHRITALLVGGRIKNDYDDFLGTGMPLKSEDNIHSALVRYLYRLKGDWFVGGQFLVTNYQMFGQTALDDDILNTLGLRGFESGGVGLNVLHDSRDVQDKPSKGWLLNINNVAYRKSIAGDSDFDVYRLDYRGFWTHGDGNVIAFRQSNQWTVDAPPSAYAPVRLRGYTAGEYLGKNMSSLEVEERYRIAARWTATFFAGAACLYGAGKSCDDSDNVYPTVGAGIQYLLKPEQGLVANLEFAQAKDGNNAVVFQMGYAW